MSSTFMGYERENGRIGTRNHVLIIPVDDLSNTVAAAVENNIFGTRAILHPYGRLQFGADLDLTFRTLAGYGRNPNVASAIVVGIEDNWTNRIADQISQTGKHVETVSIEGSGDLKAIEKASRLAREMVQESSTKTRKEFDVSNLIVSTKCGESDTTSGLASNPTVGVVFDRLVDEGATVIFGETSELTGAEKYIAEKMANNELKDKFMKIFNDYQDVIKSQGVDLLGSQPTEGNIKGGLSTIEEKALGNIQKAGTKKITGVLDYAEEPKSKGLNFMNTSSAAAEAVTLFAAAGAVVHLFTTGQGNIVGNHILPVIKTTANPKTAKNMAEHIDLDLSGLLKFEYTLKDAGDKLYNLLLETASGKLTSNEVLKHYEFALTKLYISA
ncbi:UxaA family hydrolase [Acidiplasma sp.]|uniref:UxaA family hydrolase n=1 Tax=Acidiplasma sp. TaxID=1872114 RepID=UPI0025870C35|nr:UxaA family hydrolase [Acidiplasma sp.]